MTDQTQPPLEAFFVLPIAVDLLLKGARRGIIGGMERREFTLGENDAGRRLDRILRRVLKESSQSTVEGALRKGLVRLNGKKAAASAITSAGDVLSCASFLLADAFSQGPEAAQNEVSAKSDGGAPLYASRKSADLFQAPKAPAPAACPYPIVFKNEHLLLIDKPAGVAVHGAGSVAEFFAQQKTDSLAFAPAPLHRLDKGTSGLLAVSQSLAGARWFCQKIATHEIKKFYWGIVCGSLDREETWEDQLNLEGVGAFHTPQAVLQAEPAPFGASQNAGRVKTVRAKTIATPLKRGLYNGAPITLVQFQIFTGRKRQIRAQCAARNIPLLGDNRYGQSAPTGRFYLRAVRLEFPKNELGLPPKIDITDSKECQDFLAFFDKSR